MVITTKQPALLHDFKVHPAASVFPMLGDDELRDLAADIKANGLNHPITLDKHGVLIDGRNRWAGCNLAGVEPDFETFEGDEVAVIAFILSENVRRRHMSKGQIAMAVVLACKESLHANTRKTATQIGMSHQRVHHANTVLEYTPDLVDAVLDGSLGLDAAYEQARARKDAATSRDAQMGQLRQDHPDLADLVEDERMSLSEALKLAASRAAQARAARESALRVAGTLCDWLDPGESSTTDDRARQIVREISGAPAALRERLDRGADTLVAMIALLTEGEESVS